MGIILSALSLAQGRLLCCLVHFSNFVRERKLPYHARRRRGSPQGGDAQMTSALGGGEGVSQFLTKGREVAWIWY